MKLEVNPYQKIGDMAKAYGRTKGNSLLQTILSREKVIILVIAFLLGRASLAGDLMPFGISVFAATAGLDISKLLVAAFVAAGMATNGSGGQIYVAASAMLLFTALCIPFRSFKSGISLNME
jgi:stage II sporulation protein E